MRNAPNVAFLAESDAPPYGILLPADYCAQHEWGIERLQDVLGIYTGDRPQGIASRTATTHPGERLGWDETLVPARPVPGRRKGKKPADVPCAILTVSRYRDVPGRNAPEKPRLPYREEQTLTAEWSGDGFRIYAFGEETCATLAAFRDAILAGDVAVWLGGAGHNPFARAGLIVAVASRIPAEGSEVMLAADLDRNAMLDAAAATGIAERLKATSPTDDYRRVLDDPHGYYALSPRWTPEADRERTAHPVVFFLNPMQQDKVNFGWFTVEELDAWIAGHGPVPMTAAQVAQRKSGRRTG